MSAKCHSLRQWLWVNVLNRSALTVWRPSAEPSLNRGPVKLSPGKIIGHWKQDPEFTRPENFVQSTKTSSFAPPLRLLQSTQIGVGYDFLFFSLFQSNARVLDQWAALLQRGLFCFEGKKTCVTSALLTNIALCLLWCVPIPVLP